MGLGESLPRLIERLRPFKCGMLRETVTNVRESADQPYTMSEVGWHEYFSTRMYTVINGDVYDMTGEWFLPPETCVVLDKVLTSAV